MVKQLGDRKQTIVQAAMAKVKAAKVEKATKRLTELYEQRDKAAKILRNIERDIEDYLQEMDIDDADAPDVPK